MRSSVSRERVSSSSLGHSTATALEQASAARRRRAAGHPPLQRHGRAAPSRARPPRRRAHRRPAHRRRSSPTSSTCTLPRSASRSAAKPRSDGARDRCRRLAGAAPSAARRCGSSMARPASTTARSPAACSRWTVRSRNVVHRCGVSSSDAIARRIDDTRRPARTRRPRARSRSGGVPTSSPSTATCGVPRPGSEAQPFTADRIRQSEADRVRWAHGHRVGAVRRVVQHAAGARAPRPASTSPARSSRWPRRRRSPSRSSRTCSCSFAAIPTSPATASSRSCSSAVASRSLATSRRSRRARQVHLPTGARRARVHRLRHGRRALPARRRPVHRGPHHPAPAGLRIGRMPFAAALVRAPARDPRDRRGRRRHPRPARARRRRSRRLRHRSSSPPPTSASLEDVASTVRALLHPGAARRHGGLGARRWPRGRGDVGDVGLRRPLATTAADPADARPPRRLRRRRRVGRGRPSSWTPPRAARCCCLPTRSASPRPRRPARRSPSGDPTSRSIGGMASAAAGPGRQPARARRPVSRRGAVGVLARPRRPDRHDRLPGCRPIGEPLIVTKSERNILYEIGGEHALDRLLESVRALPPEDLASASNGLHLGRAVDESKADFEPRRLRDPQRASGSTRRSVQSRSAT